MSLVWGPLVAYLLPKAFFETKEGVGMTIINSQRAYRGSVLIFCSTRTIRLVVRGAKALERARGEKQTDTSQRQVFTLVSRNG